MNDKQLPVKHTQEFKLEVVRLVKTGRSVGMTAKMLGIPWVEPEKLGAAPVSRGSLAARGSR